MSLVSLTDVVKEFDGVRAVDGVTFSIDRGEVVGFLGPNGAGKTTAMRLITYILEADEGEVRIDGQPVDRDPRELRRRVGYLPETNPLYTEMLVSEYLAYIGRLRGLSPGELGDRLEAAVRRTGLTDVYHRPIEHLSKGFRQRVGLAQAILTEPEILILDEPTEGLDPNQRVEIRRLITELGEQRTVLLSTHVLQEVQLTCSRVIIIHRGRIIADGSVEDLVAGGRRGVRVSLEVDGEPGAVRGAVASLPSVAAVEDVAGPATAGGETASAAGGPPRQRLIVTGAASADPRRDISRLSAERGWDLWELHLERESLEELFHELTRDPEADAEPATSGRADAEPATSGQADDAPATSGQADDAPATSDGRGA
ncbi:MAG: ATP-binding cassette domain-containing protein [Gemmatimonadota bacterium]